MVVILSLPVLPIKAANTSIIAEYHCTAVWVSMMQEQKSLTLRLRSSLEYSSNVDASIFALKGAQYFDYVSQRRCLFLIIRLARPKLVDALLPLISRMGQRVCHYPVCRENPPIQSLSEDVTMQPFVCRRCKIKNCWHSVDAQLNDILTVSGCSTVVCIYVYSRYWQPINRFYV